MPSQFLSMSEGDGRITFGYTASKTTLQLGLAVVSSAAIAILIRLSGSAQILPSNLSTGLTWFFGLCALLTFGTFLTLVLVGYVYVVELDTKGRTWCLRTGTRRKPTTRSGSLDEGARVVTEYGEIHVNFKHLQHASVILEVGEPPMRLELARFPKFAPNPAQIKPEDVETAIRISQQWSQKLGVELKTGI